MINSGLSSDRYWQRPWQFRMCVTARFNIDERKSLGQRHCQSPTRYHGKPDSLNGYVAGPFHTLLAWLAEATDPRYSPNIAFTLGASSGRPLMLKMICAAFFSLLAIDALGQEKTINRDGVSLTYDRSTFSKVEIVEVKKEPLPNPHDRLNCTSSEPTVFVLRGFTIRGIC